jgi:hypothetical protein
MCGVYRGLGPFVDCIDLYVVTFVEQLRRTAVNDWKSNLVKTLGIHEHMIVPRNQVEELKSMMIDTDSASVPPRCVLT